MAITNDHQILKLVDDVQKAAEKKEYEKLIDHFAAAALTGLISIQPHTPSERSKELICDRSYEWAHDMLEAKKRDKD